MADSQLIAGLDLGTTKVCAIVGELMDDGIDIIGIGSVPSKIRRHLADSSGVSAVQNLSLDRARFRLLSRDSNGSSLSFIPIIVASFRISRNSFFVS